MFRLVKALVLIVLVLGATVGTVSASQASLPGTPLYDVKLVVEDCQLSLARRPEAAAHLAMVMAQTRVEEALKLAEGGQEIPDGVADRYQARVALALQSAGEVTGTAQRTRLQEGIDHELAVQMRQMEYLRTRLRDGIRQCDPEPVEKMIQTMTRAQVHLGAPPEAPEQGPRGPQAERPEEAEPVLDSAVDDPEPVPGPDTAPGPRFEDAPGEPPEAPVFTGPAGPVRNGDVVQEPAGPNGPCRAGDETCEPPAGPAEPVDPGDGAGGGPHGDEDTSQNQGDGANRGSESGAPTDTGGGEGNSADEGHGNQGGDQGGGNDSSGGGNGGSGGGRP